MKVSRVPSYTPKIGDRLYQRPFYGLTGWLGKHRSTAEVVKVTRDNVHVRVDHRRTPVRLKLAELRECGAAAQHPYFSTGVWMIERDGDLNAAKERIEHYRHGWRARTAADYKRRVAELRSILQREHPDKGGNVVNFMKIKKELDKVRRK